MTVFASRQWRGMQYIRTNSLYHIRLSRDGAEASSSPLRPATGYWLATAGLYPYNREQSVTLDCGCNISPNVTVSSHMQRNTFSVMPMSFSDCLCTQCRSLWTTLGRFNKEVFNKSIASPAKLCIYRFILQLILCKKKIKTRRYIDVQ